MAPTQAALYGELADDLHLSWSEAELPERERTKHVHRLHPYLGKFVPQLVEALLGRYVQPGGRVLDPFAGSGTTLVQCLESGYDAVGVDVAAFNCLLMRVKTARLRPLPARDRSPRRARAVAGEPRRRPARIRARVVRAGRGGRAPPLPLDRRRLRARRRPSGRARARRTLGAADDALRPRLPEGAAARAVLVPQAPTHVLSRAGGRRSSSRRYLLDTLARIKAFQKVRARGRAADGRARRLERRRARRPLRRDPHVAAVPGPHRLPRAAPLRVRAPRARRSARARARRRRARDEQAAIDGVRRRASRASSVAAVERSLEPMRPVIVVVNDRRDLYPEILERSGLRLVERLERHVNRRTGRRAGEYFESILVCVRET